MIMKNNRAVGRRLNQAIGFCLMLVFVSVVVTAVGEGFRNSTIGTFGLGRSGGRIAQVDDATAVQQNPANLIGITNTEAQLALSVIYINVDYQSPLGQSASTIHPWKVLPNFFLAMPLKNDRYAVGLGVTVPYGLANQWNSSATAFSQKPPYGSLTYFAPHYSQLITINLNPTIAVKLTDKISLGAGLDVMWSDLEFKQFLSPNVPNLQAHAEGDGVGIGGNLGLTWHITERQQLALTYRSTMTVDYSGTTKFDNLPGVPSTSFGSQIKYPNIISVGYGINLTDKIRVETDFEWLQFSQFRNLPVNVGNNLLGVPSQSIPEKWKNTFTVGIGGDWKFADHWVLRAGYQFFESPVPDTTFSPTIPDANQNVFTIGLGWKGRHSSLEAAYGLDFYNERNISNDQNPAFNGKYTFNVHLISLAYNYAF
jgi:long-chain fatty acid transport protein